MSTGRPCHFAHSLQVLKQYIWSLILYIFLPVFIHVYSPGSRAGNPLGSELYLNMYRMSLWSFAVSFFHKMTFWQFFPYKIIMDQIWPCHKIGRGQPKVIIWTNFYGPKALILHTKAQGHWPFCSGEEDFWRVFTVYGCGGHLGSPEKNFVPPTHGGSTWNLALIGPVVLEKKIFKNGGRTTEHAYTISSPMSPKAQVS